MGNILTAIQAIVEHSSIDVIEDHQGSVQNRANQMGDALEDYIKNAFANCFGQDKRTRIQLRNETFSYFGNSNNPPDAMLRGGDAIEIKKLESLDSHLQLNNSYPINKLRSDNPKICSSCRNCEVWNEKNMLYVVGQVSGQQLHNLFFIYGDLYCDAHDVYENVIKDRVKPQEMFELTDINELGRINKVDHLGISDLRVRGMWLIKSPFQLFGKLTKEIEVYTFKLVALIPEYKYDTFDNVYNFEEFCKDNGITISDVEIQDPQNTTKLIATKLITFYY